MTFDIEVKARDLKIDDKLNDYVTKKVGKLDRFIKDIQEVRVELTHAKSARQATDRYVAQITLRGKGFLLRSEERTDDIFASFDTALDKIQRRIERYKGKRFRGRGDGASVREPTMEEMIDEFGDVKASDIVRRKKFTLIPMDEREAIEQSQLLGHEDFFVFFNLNNNSVNVLYTRRDGTLGLIETEIG
jgi:putative sigma-54 modulation protein